jgi:hypothetical protein
VAQGKENAQFHNDINLLVVFVDLMKLEDVVVVHLLHDLDLATQELDIILKHRLFDDFNSKLFFILLCDGFINDGKSSTAKRSQNEISGAAI